MTATPKVLLDPAIQIGADLARWLEIGGGQGLRAAITDPAVV